MNPEELLLSRMRRRESQEKSDVEWRDEGTAAEFPHLFAFLSVTMVNGSPRKPGKVVVFTEDGRLKAAVSDQQTEEVLFVTLTGLETLWYELEKAVGASDADWRKSRRAAFRRS